MSNLTLVAVGVTLVNLPFGFWRTGTKRFSLAWFLAVHVPLVVALRLPFHVGWQLSTLPVLVVMYFLGQSAGGLIKNYKIRESQPSAGLEPVGIPLRV